MAFRLLAERLANRFHLLAQHEFPLGFLAPSRASCSMVAQVGDAQLLGQVVADARQPRHAVGLSQQLDLQLQRQVQQAADEVGQGARRRVEAQIGGNLTLDFALGAPYCSM